MKVTINPNIMENMEKLYQLKEKTIKSAGKFYRIVWMGETDLSPDLNNLGKTPELWKLVIN